MTGFAKWVYEIQPVIWASLIAFGGASATVIVTAWTASSQRKEADRLATLQRQHDAEQKERERLMAMRRDVFLRGADGVSAASNILGRIADLSAPEAELASLSAEALSSLARVQVVGNEATISALAEFSTIYLALYTELLVIRARTITCLQQRVNEKRPHDTPASIALFESELRLKLAEMCLKSSQKLLTSIPPALFAVRDELGINTDRERYLTIQTRGLRQQSEAMGRFFERIAELRDHPQKHPE